ncbi:MAG TPA: anti-sigma regulatory factor [Balneolaceae bacterium]
MKNKASKTGNEGKSALAAKKIFISKDSDLIAIRKYGREMAAAIGHSKTGQTLIVTALSEICRNILEYAGNGEVILEYKNKNQKKCLYITAIDSGPGIDDINSALKDGFTTGKGMGMGLSGTKRIMDEFDIESDPGTGTTIKMCKYLNN